MKVADWFGEPPALVVTSSYQRTTDTAAYLVQKFDGLAREQWAVHEMTFLSPESWRGSTFAERVPQVEAYWRRCDPSFVDGPGAESFDQFLARVTATAAELERRSEPTIAIFSHGHFLRALLWYLLAPRLCDAAAMRAFRDLAAVTAMPNASITEMVGDGARWRIGGPSVEHLPHDLITT